MSNSYKLGRDSRDDARLDEVLSNQADVKSGTDDAAASFMRACWPAFGIAYRMLGSASEASEKPAALLCDLL